MSSPLQGSRFSLRSSSLSCHISVSFSGCWSNCCFAMLTTFNCLLLCWLPVKDWSKLPPTTKSPNQTGGRLVRCGWFTASTPFFSDVGARSSVTPPFARGFLQDCPLLLATSILSWLGAGLFELSFIEGITRFYKLFFYFLARFTIFFRPHF